MDISFRYFVITVCGTVLIFCLESEAWRWWTREDEDEEWPGY